MTERKANQWLGLLANFGVVIGIVLLVYELRQNQEMMRAQIRNELSQGLNAVIMAPVESPQLAGLLRRASLDEPLTEDENMQAASYLNALFRYWENVHYQYRMGLYDDSEFEAHRDAMQAAFHLGAYRRDYWCNYRQYYSGEFRRFIDEFTDDRPCGG